MAKARSHHSAQYFAHEVTYCSVAQGMCLSVWCVASCHEQEQEQGQNAGNVHGKDEFAVGDESEV
ncbi:MAG: hypothetical protein ACKPKO_45030, partial [Candidatus Fonsibacter sp.]